MLAKFITKKIGKFKKFTASDTNIDKLKYSPHHEVKPMKYP